MKELGHLSLMVGDYIYIYIVRVWFIYIIYIYIYEPSGENLAEFVTGKDR